MEQSSPLAAMQPPSLMGSWGFTSHARPAAHHHFSGPHDFGPDTFNFKDISMAAPPTDYFSCRPVRGSSPTASLAADLSQNFHIDKSPQFATPRRSLFTSSLFGTIDGRERMTTPPLPSSSPGVGNDSMDISPLPHKPAFTITQKEIIPVEPSPAAIEPPSAPPMSSPSELPELPVEASRRPPSLIERKKSSLTRPSMAMAKGHSTNSVSVRSFNRESRLPPFTFGIGQKPSTSTSMSLGECFADSPPQERRLSTASPSFGLMGPPRSKPLFAGSNANARNGSPINGHVRKPVAPVARPRKQFRRSLSMFEHPGDVIDDEKKPDYLPSPTLAPIVDEEPPKLQLPHFVPDGQAESLPRLTKETLVDVLDGKYRQAIDDFAIIDCRFEYEFDGGHIEGAKNFNSKELLARQLFESPSSRKTVLIFHCEYSAHRAPIMAKFVRGQDRAANDFRYPHLTYPEIYILDGGYSAFYAHHQARCFPQDYVEMGAKEHANTCEREMGKLRQRTKLSRAQTFAFGSHDQEMDYSPTGPCQPSPDSMMGSPLAPERFDRSRVHARRMLSY
ncbi:MAG: cell division cycle- protein [Sclerophora amabilis]|nr:MAG: cell division cycle- protein [Sclerophora amabilis]